MLRAPVTTRGQLSLATPPNAAVLANLYLSAVLPCLDDLAAQDPLARDIIKGVSASISLGIIGGPAATVHLRDGQVRWEAGACRAPAVALKFLSSAHLNAFFSGRTWAVPLPAWGAWRVGVLVRFSKLAQRLQAVLDGYPAVLQTPAGRRLHARLSLITAGLGLRALAAGDPAARQALEALPHGLAAFAIEGEENATVWFDHGSSDFAGGWGMPPRRPDVRITFMGIDVAFGAMRDEIDQLAAVGAGRIKVEGLVPLADGLGFVMERLPLYLRRPA